MKLHPLTVGANGCSLRPFPQSMMQTYFRIILPLAVPGIFTTAFLYLSPRGMNFFSHSLSIPKPQNRTRRHCDVPGPVHHSMGRDIGRYRHCYGPSCHHGVIVPAQICTGTEFRCCKRINHSKKTALLSSSLFFNHISFTPYSPLQSLPLKKSFCKMDVALKKLIYLS